MKGMVRVSLAVAVVLGGVVPLVGCEGGTVSQDVETETQAAVPTSTAIDGATDTNFTGTLVPSFTSRGPDDYTIGYYVADGALVAEHSTLDAIEKGKSGLEISGLDLDARGSGFTLLAVEGETPSKVTLSDSTVALADEDQGRYASDFTGLGSAVVVAGANQEARNSVTLRGVTLGTEGFARDGIVVADGADAIIRESTFKISGADPATDAYEGYLNSANQAYMISPPWVLGISGGARAANVVGEGSSLTVADSYLAAGGWAVLSTDACTNPKINVVNSTLMIDAADSGQGIESGFDLLGYRSPYGSGYGTYAIGGATENFYGTDFLGMTYATIMCGSGSLYYGPSKSAIDLKNASGDSVLAWQGTPRDSHIESVWGIMDHKGGTAVLDSGSIWETEEATILEKGPNQATFEINGATIRPRSGVIFQLMDSDDGYGTSADGGDTAALTYGGTPWGTPTFSGGWYEPAGAGLPRDLGTLSTGGAVSSTVRFGKGSYEGDLLNASGSGKGVSATGLAVELTGAELTGAVSSTQAIHGLPYSKRTLARLNELAKEYGTGVAWQGGVGGPNGDGTYTVAYQLLDDRGKVVTDEKEAAFIQLTQFTSHEYYLLGHMLNFETAGATCEVSLADGAVWNVTRDCYLTYLSVGKGCAVVVADGVTLHVGDVVLEGMVAAGDYGKKATYTASMPDEDRPTELQGSPQEGGDRPADAPEGVPAPGPDAVAVAGDGAPSPDPSIAGPEEAGQVTAIEVSTGDLPNAEGREASFSGDGKDGADTDIKDLVEEARRADDETSREPVVLSGRTRA